jgi:hypothetical protein
MSRWLTQTRLAFRFVFRRKRIDEELGEEIQYHLERQIAERSPGVSGCRGSARPRNAGGQLCPGKARLQNGSADCAAAGVDATCGEA